MCGTASEVGGPKAHVRVEFSDLGTDPVVGRRHDVKTVLDASRLSQLFSRVPDDWQLVTAGGSIVQPYHTVYFDTHDLRLFRDHRQGRLRRFKVRTRHYSDGTVMLEVKLKGPGRLTQKIRRVHHEHGSIVPADLAWVSHHLERELGRSAPEPLIQTAWTRYERTILRAPDGTERLTIDRSLTTGNGSASSDASEAVIAEVKSLAPRSSLLPALHAIGARPLRLSKYAVAVHRTHQAHANRWRRGLRRLEHAG